MTIPTQDSLRGSGPLAARSPVPTQPGPGFRALVVDDHPLVRESMVSRLTSMGARDVIEAASVAEARARAHASGPRDLCVLDLGLPDGSGLDLLADLRSAGWSRRASRTRRSASRWDCPPSPSRATSPASPASSAPATGPRWSRWRCALE